MGWCWRGWGWGEVVEGGVERGVKGRWWRKALG